MLDLVVERGIDDHAADLLLASLGGPEQLEAALAGERPARPKSEPAQGGGTAPGAFLASIEATGFRGIGPTARLELTPGPGLTVVVGRNGSGKSSFAEALEVVLTGDSWRWRNKSAVWKQGWRNLHVPTGAKVEATFVVEGATGPTTVTREWPDDASDTTGADTSVQPHGQRKTDLAGYGWAQAIDLFRPMLSHPELAAVVDTPSSLFDALSSVLGIDELAAAAELLRRTRLELEKPLKESKKDLKDRLIPELSASDDERAVRCLEALSGRTWDLTVAEATVSGLDDAVPATDYLDRLSLLAVRTSEEVEEAAEGVAKAVSTVAEQTDTEAGRSRRMIDLLQTALDEHAEHGDSPCPVCGVGSMDAAWRSQAEAQLADLRSRSGAYDQATAELKRAVARARALISPVPDVLVEVGEVDVAPARAAWEKWMAAPDEPGDLVAHLRSTHAPLVAATDAVRAEATQRRAEIEDAWRPLALRVGVWINAARQALAADEQVGHLRAAEAGIGEITVELRTNRFEPISRQAIELWESMRLQSNVELTGVELVGKGTQRRVDLSVSVDGAEGAALSVVSQGEVNCLALSLFFPRVMLPESPFRFIVIDDPVQAMDPARVDGLARVLAQVAETRQLVVFTHDDRLPASLLYLNLPHKVLAVNRRKGSEVQVTDRIDPVNQYFIDARAVAKDEKLPEVVASRVVPGFCRSGIEAACIEAVRRRRLSRGDPHVAIELAVDAAQTTMQKAALALFDNTDEGGRVLTEINRQWGKDAADAFQDARQGAHKGFKGSLMNLIGEAQSLAAKLRAFE